MQEINRRDLMEDNILFDNEDLERLIECYECIYFLKSGKNKLLSEAETVKEIAGQKLSISNNPITIASLDTYNPMQNNALELIRIAKRAY